jgi:ATP-dependent DNA helicase RecG
MKPSLLKLKKFFRLEAERNYDNRSVFGGLYMGLQSWEADARADGIGEELILDISGRLRGYEGQTPGERQKTLIQLWLRIEGEESNVVQNGKATPPPKPASKQPTPAKSHLAKAAANPAAARNTPAPKPRRQKAAPRALAEGGPAALDAPTTVLYGVGTVNAKRLQNLGISTLGDMLYHFPRRYEDYSHLTTIFSLLYGRPVTIAGTIRSVSTRPVKGRRSITEIIVDDGSGALRVTWFNQPWMARNLHVGDEVVLAG